MLRSFRNAAHVFSFVPEIFEVSRRGDGWTRRRGDRDLVSLFYPRRYATGQGKSQKARADKYKKTGPQETARGQRFDQLSWIYWVLGFLIVHCSGCSIIRTS